MLICDVCNKKEDKDTKINNLFVDPIPRINLWYNNNMSVNIDLPKEAVESIKSIGKHICENCIYDLHKEIIKTVIYFLKNKNKLSEKEGN